ncbi:hypothetical protein [Cohnella nanjingensis]|uniref:Uncharacterized protein n=1 Tax=Cohnella nanjingensis TaxID=1387779 RepID=A0A7X0RSD7_9BACL|nr:hypothetical protein [Cohnella nanjingensis]MBB6672813.1 hypothetical protein [Cohnella nanjingensis]
MNVVIAILLLIIVVLLIDINSKLPRRDRVREAVRNAMKRDRMRKRGE